MSKISEDAMALARKTVRDRFNMQKIVDPEAYALRIAEAIMEDRASRPAAGPIVKPLEWEDGAPGMFYGHAAIGPKYVTSTSGHWWLQDGPTHKAETLDEAKAAAQADYEKRVLSVLADAPAAPQLGAKAGTLLSNLLARIHRDGGHYEGKHGTEKACADADLIVANLIAGAEELVEALKDNLAHLVAAHSLLSRSPKTAAPSNKMFDQMLKDYAASIERGRAAIAKHGGRS